MATRASLISRRSFGKSSRPAPGTVLFFDDFTGSAYTAIDHSKWADYIWLGRGTNNNPTYVTDNTWTGSLSQPGNSCVDGNGNALLVIRADGAPDNDASRPFTSAQFNTKQGFTPPCSIEGKFAVPTAPGTWPGFWTANLNLTPGVSWPKSGEIDIFEIPVYVDSAHGTPVTGHQTVSFMHLHSVDGSNNHVQAAGSYDNGWDYGTQAYSNVITNPKASTNLTGWSIVGTSGESTGTNLTRLTSSLPANLTSAGFTTAMRFTLGNSTAGQRLIVTVASLASLGLAPGNTISFGAWIAASWATTGQGVSMALQWYKGSTYLGQNNTTGTTDPAGGFSITEGFTIPATVAGQVPDTVHITLGGTPSTPSAGMTLDVTGIIISPTSTLPRNVSTTSQFADGDTPGWSWTGTANASSSLVTPWHVWRADWYPDHIDMYIDNVKRWSYSSAQAAVAGMKWAYDGTYPQSVIFGIGVGGSWPGTPTPPVPWSTLTMMCDYIKVTAL